MGYLRQLAYAGAAERFAGKPHEARAYEMIEHELEIIEELHFPGYFLVVWEIAKFCRDRASCARAADRPRTPRSATRCGSPPSTPSTTT